MRGITGRIGSGPRTTGLDATAALRRGAHPSVPPDLPPLRAPDASSPAPGVRAAGDLAVRLHPVSCWSPPRTTSARQAGKTRPAANRALRTTDVPPRTIAAGSWWRRRQL